MIQPYILFSLKKHLFPFVRDTYYLFAYVFYSCTLQIIIKFLLMAAKPAFSNESCQMCGLLLHVTN
jgi:hypothetical protein